MGGGSCLAHLVGGIVRTRVLGVGCHVVCALTLPLTAMQIKFVVIRTRLNLRVFLQERSITLLQNHLVALIHQVIHKLDAVEAVDLLILGLDLLHDAMRECFLVLLAGFHGASEVLIYVLDQYILGPLLRPQCPLLHHAFEHQGRNRVILAGLV